jgi:hypothetical protein
MRNRGEGATPLHPYFKSRLLNSSTPTRNPATAISGLRPAFQSRKITQLVPCDRDVRTETESTGDRTPGTGMEGFAAARTPFSLRFPFCGICAPNGCCTVDSSVARWNALSPLEVPEPKEDKHVIRGRIQWEYSKPCNEVSFLLRGRKMAPHRKLVLGPMPRSKMTTSAGGAKFWHTYHRKCVQAFWNQRKCFRMNPVPTVGV